MKKICTICARGGSKGVKNKNIRLLAGKPLIAYSVEQALKSRLFDSVAVSSDSEEILHTAKQYGADLTIRRPDALARDTSAKIPAIQHCVDASETRVKYRFDIVVDLDATSPLRSINDIRDSLALLERKNCSNVITGTPARRSPYFNMVEVDESGKVRLSKQLPTIVVRRQDAPPCYDMNASIYVWKRDALFEYTSLFNDTTALHVMPEERSIDIDSELDFKLVEFVMLERGRS